MFMQKFHKKYAIFAETSTKILNKEMELIPSFAVDHTNLQPGIYVSRRDEVGGEAVTNVQKGRCTYMKWGCALCRFANNA